ncbi:MAG: ABC transporter permease subunit, partial [Myxococcales bacterium]|nr:ABC transporter permease subunit [Myxococcales bacterium]
AAVAVLINDQNMLYLILTPTLLPVVIGAYSIIGEKEAKSLEPLLATPLRTGELVLGKAVAALVPAVVIGLVQFALAIGTIALLSPPGVVEHALRPLWIVGIFGAMPLLAALSTLLAVVVSARVADVRTAQAIASLVILPVVATGVAVLVGQIYLTVGVMAVACAVLAALDVGVWWLAVRTFGRESILSRVG